MKNLFIALFLVVSISSCDFINKNTQKTTATESSTSSQTKKMEFDVSGMDSEYSEKLVEMGLKKLEGVSGVDACFKSNKITIEVEKGKLTKNTITAAIEKLGLKVK